MCIDIQGTVVVTGTTYAPRFMHSHDTMHGGISPFVPATGRQGTALHALSRHHARRHFPLHPSNRSTRHRAEHTLTTPCTGAFPPFIPPTGRQRTALHALSRHHARRHSPLHPTNRSKRTALHALSRHHARGHFPLHPSNRSTGHRASCTLKTPCTGAFPPSSQQQVDKAPC